MPRSKSKFGRNLKQLFDDAPTEYVRQLLSSCEAAEGTLLEPPPADMTTGEADQKEVLRHFLERQDGDLLSQLDGLSAGIIELSENKGVTSLETVAGQRLSNDDYEEYSDAPDALCRSIWMHSRFPAGFRDAESFYAVRRYRDHRKLYAAYEVNDEQVFEIGELPLEPDAMCRRLERALDLRARTIASILELPKTDAHPPSVMVALRHPGALSSIKDHRETGELKTYYYRPSREVVLIYTPEHKRIEVCAENFEIRGKVADIFAEVVLNQDLSAKPLTKRDFNLERFRSSFDLDIPDFDDAEILSASVVEAEMPLGHYGRRLNVKVTKDEDIDEVMQSYLQASDRLVRRFGFSKIAVAVEFVARSTGRKATLRLQISGGNTSNVQSLKDPFLRDLGFRLLSHWGLMDHLRPLTESEEARWFEFLLSLYDHPGDEVSGVFFTGAGVDPKRLLDGGYLSRKPRQVLVLVEDDTGPMEGEFTTGATRDEVNEVGGFGEERGVVGDVAALKYQIDRQYLGEVIIKRLGSLFRSSTLEIEDDFLASLGQISLDGQKVPLYLVRRLGDTKVLDRLDVALRRRHLASLGVVLSASEHAPDYLGPNVVVNLRSVVAEVDGELQLDLAAVQRLYGAKRSLIGAAQIAQVIRHSPHAGVLILPRAKPLNLTSANQILIFERLVRAATDGSGEMLTKALMEGMGSDNPKQVFTPARWKVVHDRYLCHGSSNRYWRLATPPEAVDETEAL